MNTTQRRQGPCGINKLYGKFTSVFERRFSECLGCFIWRWVVKSSEVKEKTVILVVESEELWDLRSIAQYHCEKARERSKGAHY